MAYIVVVYQIVVIFFFLYILCSFFLRTQTEKLWVGNRYHYPIFFFVSLCSVGCGALSNMVDIVRDVTVTR